MPELLDVAKAPARSPRSGVLIAGAPADGEAIATALRARGFDVSRVPLAQLEARVASEGPSVVIVDIDQDGAVEAIERLHRRPTARQPLVLLLGDPVRSAELEPQMFGHIFERPVDLAELGAHVGSAVDPRVGAAGSSPPPPSYPRHGSGRPPRRQSEAPQEISDFPSELEPVDVGSLIPASGGGEEGMPSRLGPSRISPELEQLLAAAEQRVAGNARPSSVPSVDNDADLILSHEVLAALDEPLDPEDEEGGTGSGASAATSMHGGSGQRHTPAGAAELTGPSSLGALSGGGGAWAQGWPFGQRSTTPAGEMPAVRHEPGPATPAGGMPAVRRDPSLMTPAGGLPAMRRDPSLATPARGLPAVRRDPSLATPAGGIPAMRRDPSLATPAGGLPAVRRDPSFATPAGGMPTVRRDPSLPTPAGGLPAVRRDPSLPTPAGGLPAVRRDPSFATPAGGLPAVRRDPSLATPAGGLPAARRDPSLATPARGLPAVRREIADRASAEPLSPAWTPRTAEPSQPAVTQRAAEASQPAVTARTAAPSFRSHPAADLSWREVTEPQRTPRRTGPDVVDEAPSDEERWSSGTRNEAEARRAEIEEEDRARVIDTRGMEVTGIGTREDPPGRGEPPNWPGSSGARSVPGYAGAPLVSPPREVQVRSFSDTPGAPRSGRRDDLARHAGAAREEDLDDPEEPQGRSRTISDLPMEAGLGPSRQQADPPAARSVPDRLGSEPPAVFPGPGSGPDSPVSEPPGLVGRPMSEPPAVFPVGRPFSEPPGFLPAPPGAPAVPASWLAGPPPEPREEQGPPSDTSGAPAVTVLAPGDAPRALARAVSGRISGSLAITTEAGTRRIVLHEGDLVTAASDAQDETLLAFLALRGDLDRDLAARLAGRLPGSGRHAGAALIANGYLGQDDLWPVLRAHAEWLIGHVVLVDAGTCEFEDEPPGRLKAEPNVFGGATGAEVLVDTVRRVIPPEVAMRRLGGPAARIDDGARHTLLGECALRPEEHDLVRSARGRAVAEIVDAAEPEMATLIYALVCLEVLDVLIPASLSEAPRPPEHDPLDEEAIRKRVRARLQLVHDGDYFAILGIPRDATSYEIRRAYLTLRRTFEPSRLLTAGTVDLLDDVQLVLEVLDEAYDILRDAQRRERYRRAIEAPPP